MPRGARIDAPGAVHHVIVRGIERRPIFLGPADYQFFMNRLNKFVQITGAHCFAWVLMPNHFHLVLRTGPMPLSRLMSRLLTSYAVTFNRRHLRSGYLFQNRYRSILCEEAAYLLELVRYVHLNPVRAGLVAGLNGLDSFPWSGHAVLIGKATLSCQDQQMVLAQFGADRTSALAAYRAFMADGLQDGKSHEVRAGGVIRTLAGTWEWNREDTGKLEKEAVTGSDEFVTEALADMGGREARQSQLRRDGWTPARIIDQAARVVGVTQDEIYGGGKRPSQVRGRALAAKWLVDDMGYSGAEAAI